MSKTENHNGNYTNRKSNELLLSFIQSHVSFVNLIHDWDPVSEVVNRWFEIHLEPEDQNQVQTIELTVTYNMEGPIDQNVRDLLPEWDGTYRHVNSQDHNILPEDHWMVTFQDVRTEQE